MRYIVITAKHHDGFCMFDAPGTEYKITNTPYGRDICLQLAQACHKAGMRLGFYYSPPDMHHAGYRDMRKPASQNWTGEPKRKEWAAYLDHMEGHIRKLLTDYGEVSILWFDGLTNHGKYDPARFHRLVHELSPNTLINDRLGDGYDFITPEQFIPKNGIPVRTGKPPAGIDPGGDGFFNLITALYKIPGIRGMLRKQMDKYAGGTMELTKVLQEPHPSPERFQPWETCMTMGSSWGYNPEETTWKAPGQLVRNLVEVTSRGGNFLLNIGPTAQGTFPPEARERLQYIGKWMDRNRESIYGSTYTPLQNLTWGRATRKENLVYLHVFDWPSDGRLIVDAFPGNVKSVRALAGHGLDFSQNDTRLEITLPAQPFDPDVPVIAVELKDFGQAWNEYSPATVTTIHPAKYMWAQARANFWINAIINGLIAFSSYRLRAGILPYPEVAVDILITVTLISFLVSRIGIGFVRGEIIKGNLSKVNWRGPKLPEGAGTRAWIITFVCVALFGGLFLDGLIYLFTPGGLGNWAYIILKTLYTGAGAALASALSIYSVVSDQNRS
jgi:alpha-L-fucosidase